MTHILTLTLLFIFFFNDPAPTDIYTLSLHDALPISPSAVSSGPPSTSTSACRSPTSVAIKAAKCSAGQRRARLYQPAPGWRSEEHTSELQSRRDLVCRLLLEKKKRKAQTTIQRVM